jgi:diguanylate cyclase (GGDEF)-like protein/PAS domain S-box-containing protein
MAMAAMLAAGELRRPLSRLPARRPCTALSTPQASTAAEGPQRASRVKTRVSAALTAQGLAAPVATLLALPPAALLYFVLATWPLVSMVSLKRGHWPRTGDWLRNFAWLAALYLAAAVVAGFVQLNAAQYGGVTYAVVAVAAVGLVGLMRSSFAREQAEHGKQQALIDQARQEAELNQQRFAQAFSRAAISMAIVDGRGQIVRANRALVDLLGVADEAALAGRLFAELLVPEDQPLLERSRAELMQQGEDTPCSIELRCQGAGGQTLWVSLFFSRFMADDRLGEGLIYQLHDITSRQMAESRLQHIAYHDSLTDLPNRARFNEQLSLLVSHGPAATLSPFALIFLDLDRFKIVNDSLGHIAGNELLREVARRLLATVRPGDLVARLGGDEFAVLLKDLRSTDQGLSLAQNIIDALSQPLLLAATEIMPRASVGITFSELGPRSVDELLRDADVAMYEAKAHGRGCVAVFDRSMHEHLADKLALEGDLRRAIGDGGLTLTYQPLYGLQPHRLLGFEALARWVHPTRGPVSPAVFIALAEEAGQIEHLTTWLVGEATRQLAEWHAAAPAWAHLTMNVNVSGRDLLDTGFVGKLERALVRQNLPARALTVEITETVLMSQLDGARDNLKRLRELGVRLAIDDFGTGYSSLSYLSTLPIDCLKIDRSFVAAMDERPEHLEIVRAVLTLGQALGKTVVAEGIETPGQLDALRTLGVHVGQGYLLARPLKPPQVLELLQRPELALA